MMNVHTMQAASYQVSNVFESTAALRGKLLCELWLYIYSI